MNSWCSSVKSGSINEHALANVRSPLKIYCGSSTSSAYISYDSSHALQVSSKMKADLDRCASSKISLVEFWMQHKYIQGHCCVSINNYHITLLNDLLKYDENFYNSIACLNSTIALQLRSELKSYCGSSLSGRFCSIKAALDIIDRIALLPSKKSEWTADTQLYTKAILIHYLILKKQHSTEFKDLKVVEQDVLYDSTNAILKYMKSNEISNLKSFAAYLPDSDAYTSKSSSCGVDDLCIFMKIVEQVRIYLDEADLDTNPILVNGTKLLILNTEVDYREFLRQKQLDRILTVLAEQHSTSLQIANNLKEHTTTKFAELQSYFQKVETFNQQIADANMNHIKNKINNLGKKVAKAKVELQDKMLCLISYAMIVGGLDLSSKIPIAAVSSFGLPSLGGGGLPSVGGLDFKKLMDKGLEKVLGKLSKSMGEDLNEIKKKCFKGVIPSANEQFFKKIKNAIKKGGKAIKKGVKYAISKVRKIPGIGKFFPGNIMDAFNLGLDKISQIVPLVAKMRAIYKTFKKLGTSTDDINDRLKKNDGFLIDIENLINKDNNVTRNQFETSKNNFLAKYRSFQPAVQRYEITEMAAVWKKLIDASCETINSVKTLEAGVIQSRIYNKGLCNICPRLAERMITIYGSIYDFQFELISTMIEYVRSSVALDAAKEITTDTSEVSKVNTEKGVSLTTLAMIGGLSYMTFKTHVLQTVHQYCNVLEYMEGGIQPSECKGVHTDLALLVANKEPICISEISHYYSIPTQPQGEGDEAYVNVTELFKGENVAFQIPSAKWLVDQDWIRKEEINYAFYVKQFKLYLPTNSTFPQKFYSTANPVSSNAVSPGSSEYIIIPRLPLVHEYTMGPSRLLCQTMKYRNPYTSCEFEDVSEICPLSHAPRHHLYPSIYSKWQLSIEGGENLAIPNPATNLSLLVSMQLCKIAQDYYIKEEPAVVMEASQCCPDDEFRPNITSSCQMCPEGSKSALSGYYCEKKE